MRMRLVGFFFLILSIVATSRVEAAEDRFALVIGNAKYPDSETPLKEPVKDMLTMQEELKRVGFDVEVGENLTGEAMRRALAKLYEKIDRKPGSVAMIFFSGYGIQSGRQSFMIPVDGAIWDEKDVRRDGISLDAVLGEMSTRGASVKIAILDASRRNPFERRFRQLSIGLAPVTAKTGTLVMYSAPPGTVVNDSPTERGRFVTELAKEIRAANVTAEEVFNRTRMGVSRASGNEQTPWFSSSLAEEFSFGRREQASLPAKPPSPLPSIIPSKPPPPDQITPPETKPLIPAPAPSPTNVTPGPAPGPAPTNVTPTPAPGPAPQPSTAQKRLDEINAEPAMRDLTNLILSNPNDQAAFYKRGQQYAIKGAYPEAVKDFDDALRLNPRDFEALNNRCWVRTILGELQEALKDCNDALRLRPNFGEALDSRGLLNLKSGQNTNAISDFDAALRINPKLASSLYGRGLARQRTGATAAGEKDIAQARALDPNIASEFEGYGIR